MKPIKMFGLAALMALMAMAFVGVTSAMATEETALCSADEATCSAANTIEHVHETSVGKAKLLTSFGTTECNVLFLGDTPELTGSGASLAIEGTFTYTNCEQASGSCTATEENGPAEIALLKESHEAAKVTGEYLVHLVCGKTIDCSYNATGLVGTAKGPLLSTQTNGEVSISGASVNKETGGFVCPKTTTLDITTTPLVKTYLSKGTHYCVMPFASVGLYQKVTAGVCEEGLATGSHLLELAYGRPGLAVGRTVCLRLSTARGGRRNRCQTLGSGFYELGTIM